MTYLDPPSKAKRDAEEHFSILNQERESEPTKRKMERCIFCGHTEDIYHCCHILNVKKKSKEYIEQIAELEDAYEHARTLWDSAEDRLRNALRQKKKFKEALEGLRECLKKGYNPLKGDVHLYDDNEKEAWKHFEVLSKKD